MFRASGRAIFAYPAPPRVRPPFRRAELHTTGIPVRDNGRRTAIEPDSAADSTMRRAGHIDARPGRNAVACSRRSLCAGARNRWRLDRFTARAALRQNRETRHAGPSAASRRCLQRCLARTDRRLARAGAARRVDTQHVTWRMRLAPSIGTPMRTVTGAIAFDLLRGCSDFVATATMGIRG